MANRGWLVLAAVFTMALIATFNIAQHPTLSLSAFHLDELRQHQPRPHRVKGAACVHAPYFTFFEGGSCIALQTSESSATL
jgi:hypothetical protein